MSFDAFATGLLADFLALAATLRAAGLGDLDAVDAALRAEIGSRPQPDPPEARAMALSVRCAKCGGQARVLPVNVSAATRIDGAYRSAVVCLDRRCLHVEYSEQAAGDIAAVGRMGRRRWRTR